MPRSRFLGDTSVHLPEFQRDICKFWGTHQIHLIFTCKIENSFPEISVHFNLNLSSMLIVLAQEVVSGSRPALGAFLRDIDSKIAGIPQCRALGTALGLIHKLSIDYK